MKIINLKTAPDVYGGQKGMITALRETIMADSRAQPAPLLRDHARFFELIFIWVIPVLNREEDPFHDLDPSHYLIAEFIQGNACRSFLALTTHLANFVLFLTSCGHIGITTGDIENGDKVALLAGSDHPVVLRRNGNTWRCIESSYVHGIMDGEAWPADKNTDQLDVFLLT